MKFNKKYIRFHLICIVLTILSCEDPLVDKNDLNKVIVEGYLFVGKPVEDIKLSKVLHFQDEDSEGEPISDADISIEVNNKIYKLTANSDKEGYYHYSGDDLVIKEGEEYTLSFSYFGKDIKAKTVVPEAPKNFRVIGDNVIRFDPKKNEDQSETKLKAKWENAAKNYYTYATKNTDKNPKKVFPEQDDDFDGFGFFRPTNADSLVLEAFSLSHYGKHDLILYRINEEYLELYNAENQDSRSINEPKTNVENGLGVFTAFSSDTLEIIYKK